MKTKQIVLLAWTLMVTAANIFLYNWFKNPKDGAKNPDNSCENRDKRCGKIAQMEAEKREESNDKSQTANTADQLTRVSSNIHIPSDILFNILKRLPAKSLMRFKCVSKAWQTLIYDPYFAESYHIHSQTRPDAYYLLFNYRINSSWPQAVFPTNLEATFSHQLPGFAFNETSSDPCTEIVKGRICLHENPCTEIVEGLICLQDPEKHQIRILNLTTGEKSAPLPKGQLKALLRFRSSYYLGFDPVSKDYKLLHYGETLQSENRCEILTFGDRSWRIIEYPEFGIEGRSICINGTIYWDDKLTLDGKTVIQYLDLQKERFSVLFTPENAKPIVHQTRVGEDFAIVCGRLIESQVLWTLCSKEQVWLKIELKLSVFKWMWDLKYIGTTKTGEMVLTARDKKYQSIFYDLETGEFRTAELRWPKPEKIDISHVLMAYVAYPAVSNHVENILPLRCLSEGNREEDSGIS